MENERMMRCLLVVSILAGLPAGAGATEYSDTLNSNTSWSAADEVIIVGDLTVAPGITLTVGAGTVVKSRGNYRLTVNGLLYVNGTAAQPVYFQPESGGASPGAYYGLVSSSGATVTIDHAIITKASYCCTTTRAEWS